MIRNIFNLWHGWQGIKPLTCLILHQISQSISNLKMKLFTILFSTFVTVNANMYNNLGFMRSVSKRFPHSKHRLTSVDVQSVGRISSGKKVPQNKPIQKSHLVKSRRLRNTLTTVNAQHYDQPLLYRTNPVYAMKPDVMNRIHYLEEMRPWNLCKNQ